MAKSSGLAAARDAASKDSEVPAAKVPEKPKARPQATGKAWSFLSKVTTGIQEVPRRICLYGPGGIGKSSFGAAMPKPIFVSTEHGNHHLDVASGPLVTTYSNWLKSLDELREGDHDFETAVFDSITALEPIIWRETCRRGNATNIEEVGGGFQKGYVAALDLWLESLRRIEQLWVERKMNIVLIGHSAVVNFKNPEGPDYERYDLALHNRASGVVQKWVDDMLFANYVSFAQAVEGKKGKYKGIDNRARMIYTQRTAAYEAKTRSGLPEKLALDYLAYEEARVVGAGKAKDIRETITRQLESLDSDVVAKANAAVKDAGDNIDALMRVLNRVNARAGETQDESVQTAE